MENIDALKADLLSLSETDKEFRRIIIRRNIIPLLELANGTYRIEKQIFYKSERSIESIEREIRAAIGLIKGAEIPELAESAFFEVLFPDLEVPSIKTIRERIKARTETTLKKPRPEYEPYSEWRKKIINLYPTKELFITEANKDKNAFMVDGKDLNHLLWIFQLFGNAIVDEAPFQKLVTKIYEPKKLRYKSEEKIKPFIDLYEKFINQFKTPRAYVDLLFSGEKDNIRIDGMNLNELAAKFRFKGKPLNSLKKYIDFGVKIYKKEIFIFREKNQYYWAEFRDPEPDNVRITIERMIKKEFIKNMKKLVPTAKEWIQMKRKEKAKLLIANFGFNEIVLLFSINSPINSPACHFKLGSFVYDDENYDSLIKEEETVRTAMRNKRLVSQSINQILKRYPTPKDFITSLQGSKNEGEYDYTDSEEVTPTDFSHVVTYLTTVSYSNWIKLLRLQSIRNKTDFELLLKAFHFELANTIYDRNHKFDFKLEDKSSTDLETEEL